jgi:hypothetical protein
LHEHAVSGMYMLNGRSSDVIIQYQSDMSA